MKIWNDIIAYLTSNKDAIEIIITILSFVISVIAMRKASKANKLQDKINTLELKLKQYEVDKIEKEKAEENRICVEAQVVRISKEKTIMKVWNSGNATAYNVTAYFQDEVGIRIFDQNKQPYDFLDPNKNYELVLMTHLGSKSKFVIITEWEDKDGNKQKRSQMCDLQSG